jgi:hypothetical protein
VNGEVLIIVPEQTIVRIVRSQLEECRCGNLVLRSRPLYGAPGITWKHIGSEVNVFHPDVLESDVDGTDYADIAKQMWFTIATDMGDVTWRWDSAKNTWGYTVAPGTQSVELSEYSDVEDKAGLGSLGG